MVIPPWVKFIAHQLIEIPVKPLQVVAKALFPQTDHYKFNLAVDVLAIFVFLLSAHELPEEHRTLIILTCPWVLFLFFFWCFWTAVHLRRR